MHDQQGTFPARRLAARRERVSDLVIDAIRTMVEEGAVREGDRLPNQNDLAQQLGVSKPSLREALNHMTRMGIIEQRPGRGIILLVDNPDLWVDRPESPRASDHASVRELIEARRIIESEMVRLAVTRMGDEQVEELEATVRRMERALAAEDLGGYLREDLSFHQQIARGSGNRYVINMYMTMRSLMGQFVADAFQDHPELVGRSMEHHTAILTAFLQRDSEAAGRAMAAHMGDIETTVG